jgi:hypothetical protein
MKLLPFFQQQYSPMVMRKFKRPDENMLNGSEGSEDAINGSILSVNSPRIGKRNRGGSFSGMMILEIFILKPIVSIGI